MSVTREDVVKFIEEMTVLELSEFIKELEAKFGVSAAAPVVAVAGPAAGAGSTAAAEKTEFDVILQSFGDKKIQVIKVVREITGLGLKEAKDLVESVPKAVKEGISKEDATAIAKKLEESGAVVQVK